jgi:hypothetical protein
MRTLDNLEDLLHNVNCANKRIADSNATMLKSLTKPESFAKRLANVFVSAEVISKSVILKLPLAILQVPLRGTFYYVKPAKYALFHK